MKSVKIFAVGLAALFTISASAQNMGGNPQMPREGRQRMTAEQRADMKTERMAESLKLTDEQKAAISQLNRAEAEAENRERAAMRKIMEEMRERREAREAAQEEQLKKILNDAQYKKWLKQKQQQQNHFQQGFGGGQGMPHHGMGGPGQMGGGFEGGGFGNGMGF